jgi:hypothetical protein
LIVYLKFCKSSLESSPEQKLAPVIKLFGSRHTEKTTSFWRHTPIYQNDEIDTKILYNMKFLENLVQDMMIFLLKNIIKQLLFGKITQTL